MKKLIDREMVLLLMMLSFMAGTDVGRHTLPYDMSWKPITSLLWLILFVGMVFWFFKMDRDHEEMERRINKCLEDTSPE